MPNFHSVQKGADLIPSINNKVFDPTSVSHILESELNSCSNVESHEAFVRKMQLRYLDSPEDESDPDWSHLPSQVLSHCISTTPHQKVTNEGIQVTSTRHVRVQPAGKLERLVG